MLMIAVDYIDGQVLTTQLQDINGRIAYLIPMCEKDFLYIKGAVYKTCINAERTAFLEI